MDKCCISLLLVCTDKMFGRISPKEMALSNAAQKKNSPKASAKKKRDGPSKSGSSKGNVLLTEMVAYMVMITEIFHS